MLRIGLTPTFDTEKKRICMPPDYISAVMAAGALPLTFPLVDNKEAWEEMLRSVDGVIFCGGADVSPWVYNEELLPCCGETVAARDVQETYLLRRAIEMNKPFLAICRGMQVMNCVCGGTLYQDIATQMSEELEHPCYERRAECVHTITVLKDSELYRCVKMETLPVNSRHHQGIKTLGKGLIVSGVAPDGLVEAVELPSPTLAMGVQWHPETLAKEHPEALDIFKLLLERSEKAKNQ